jgi:hypothetical protein
VITHVLDLQGTGFFSRGTCTGCEWAMKGHADEITKVWGTYHQSGNPLPVPERVTVPKPTGDEKVDLIEKRLIQRLAAGITYKQPQIRFIALGLSEARSALIAAHEEHSIDYVSILMARIANMPARQRAKLIPHTLTRARQQEILEDI